MVYSDCQPGTLQAAYLYAIMGYRIRIFMLASVLIGSNLTLYAQNDDRNVQQAVVESGRYWLDVDYYGDGKIGHRLDIHLPVNGRGPFPVVICIYGSAFFSNPSKAAIFRQGLGQVLLKNGFAVISINHRASTDSVFPAQIQDVKTAIRFVRTFGKLYDLKTEHMGITGYSSGGHLSALAGTTSGQSSATYDGITIDLAGKCPKYAAASDAVQAVVDWFGPTDFLIMDSCGSQMNHNDAKSPESTLVGGAIEQHKTLARLADPACYVRTGNPPFLIFHGGKDPLVPFCQSEHLYAALKEKGVPARFVPVPGGGHGPGVMIDKYYAEMISFFRQYIQ
jgi:acetyl esterase/lipase